MSALLADLSLVIPFYRSEKNIILEASMLDAIFTRYASTNTPLLFSIAVLVSSNDTYLWLKTRWIAQKYESVVRRLNLNSHVQIIL